MKKKIYIGLLAVSMALTACQKDFLETKPSETLSGAEPQEKLNGLYVMLAKPRSANTRPNQAYPRAEDFGQKSYDIYMDMLSGDMAFSQSYYGWFSNVANLQATQDFSAAENYTPWRYYYKVIYTVNDLLAQVGTPKNDDEKYIVAQAHALRGYAYFYLLQLFTTEYDPNALSIPLYTEANKVGKGKARQSEVYSLIVSDLTKAVADLNGFTRSNKGMIDKYVAEGLLAYVYGAMGNNEEMTRLSLDIVEHSGYPLTTRKETYYDAATKQGGGFNDLNTPSWMWGLDILAENNITEVSWWSQVDIFTYGYADADEIKAIDDRLYGQIRANDLRKKQFDDDNVDPDPSLNNRHRPVNKFFAPGRTRKGQMVVTTDYLYMRVDEFYLLAAEGLAKQGNEDRAKELYKQLLTLRYPEATAAADVAYVDSLTGTALLDDIYLNTRIELWGEGKSYLSLKRNKRSVTRGNNHIQYNGETFQYNDPKITLLIPEDEVNNNPNIR